MSRGVSVTDYNERRTIVVMGVGERDREGGGEGERRKIIIYWQSEDFQELTLAGKGLNMIDAVGWRPQCNISSWLGKVDNCFLG